MRQVHRGVLAAEESLSSQTKFVSLVRFNPAACDAPAWELRRGDGWQRIDLSSSQDSDAAVGLILSGESIEPGTQLLAHLTWTNHTTTYRGWRYQVVEARQLTAR